ncbi:MAG: sulfur carrier protein ThiS [Candidatus Latescibacterota bacterium]|nr:MAG: sulfur carrier protein ThiS [Candidatus Latescibacterota bacterium]
MRVTVNDMEREVRDGLTVAALLEAEGEPIGHVLVEVNGVHLHLREYDSCILKTGDRIEIIYPAAGG